MDGNELKIVFNLLILSFLYMDIIYLEKIIYIFQPDLLVYALLPIWLIL